MLKYLCVNVATMEAIVVTEETVNTLLAIGNATWIVFEVVTDQSIKTLVNKATWDEVPECGK